ncbi:MAG: hypothetical protein V4612_07975 [Pseudomonadota bacterium]
MKLSAEELERIKESHKAKDLQEILKEEADKKDDGDSGFADANSDEGGDQNFISDQNVSVAQAKRNSIYQRLRQELSNAAEKLRNAIRPINNQLRSLDKEVGGVEVDYNKIDKRTNLDVDVWDDQTKKINQEAIEAENSDAEENKSFIHLIKSGFGKKGKKRKHLGQVDLGKSAQENDEARPAGFVERLNKSKEERSHIKK